MTASDLIGGYGAALATVLAVIQYQHRRHARRAVLISTSAYFEESDGLEISVTNPSSHIIYIHHVWAGFRYLDPIKPWRWSRSELLGMLLTEEGCLTMKGVGGPLEAGSMLDCYLDCDSMKRIKDSLPKRARILQAGVWVEHSDSDEQTFHRVRFRG